MRSLFIILSTLMFTTFNLQASSLSTGPGCYQYTDSVTGKTLNVWYYKPENFNPKTPVLFVMHGMSRDAVGYRNSWVEHAKSGNYMLLTPEFSEANFPDDQHYNWGNYIQPDGTVNPREKWNYLIVERIFDDFIQSRETTDARQYYIYGLSAGSQFVQRFMLLVPEARAKLAICANAGFYTVLDPGESWPCGLKGTGVDQAAVLRYLSLPLVILLGDKDIDPDDPQLPTGEDADRQGITRLARGVYFFNHGQAAARKFKVPFGWQIRMVPGAPHGGPIIHAGGAQVLLEALAARDKTANGRQ